MTDRQFDVLCWLSDAQWLRSMDVGPPGASTSHRSETLARLVKLGLAERSPRGSNGQYAYRRTPAGRTAALGTRPIDLLECEGRHAAVDRAPSEACVCGHAREEHGNDPEFPGSTRCIECDEDCIAYEREQ